MAPYPINRDVKNVDFGTRIGYSAAIVGSPAAATETVVCQITGLDTNLPVSVGVFLTGFVAFTVGTSGASVRLRLRTGTAAGAGTTIVDTGALTGGVSATNLLAYDVQAMDTTTTGLGALASSSYCLTLTVGSGAAASTVSATNLFAFVL